MNRLARMQIRATAILAGQVTIVQRRPTFPTHTLRTETTSAKPLSPLHLHPEPTQRKKPRKAKPAKVSPQNTVTFSFHLDMSAITISMK